MSKSMDFAALIERFGSEDKCHAYLESLRWPGGVRCPRCGSDKISRIYARRQFACDPCGYQFSVRVGTIFHDSKLPLWKWFLAAYMISHAKKGVSSLHLQRMLGISYKTAWFLSHRIRAAMKHNGGADLVGIVEADETFVGGKVTGKGQGFRGNKAIVVGVLQRKGDVRMAVVKDCTRETLHAFIHRNVHDRAAAIVTDEWSGYLGIADRNTLHRSVNHRAKEYVRGQVHTNGIDSVWALLKRSVMGTYHHLSDKHLPAYLEELTFKFNNRENPHIFRDTIMGLIRSENLSFDKLVA